jgi:hypothetical protein
MALFWLTNGSKLALDLPAGNYILPYFAPEWPLEPFPAQHDSEYRLGIRKAKYGHSVVFFPTSVGQTE